MHASTAATCSRLGEEEGGASTKTSRYKLREKIHSQYMLNCAMNMIPEVWDHVHPNDIIVMG